MELHSYESAMHMQFSLNSIPQPHNPGVRVGQGRPDWTSQVQMQEDKVVCHLDMKLHELLGQSIYIIF